ncbi:MAG: DNA alkylation repair protein, partial [Opitutaceae bacterium]|nr:DNA alkylation repair protein [Opitutaceae bacterium]
MPSDSSSTNVPFKDWFGASRYHRIAEKLAGAEPRFDRELFLRIALEGLAERELMARLRQTSVAADAALPGSFSDKVAVLRKIAAPESNSFVGIWYADFVGQYGTNHTKKALAALRYFTRFGSAEFAIREFILQDPEFTLAEMIRWSTDQNEHVRRLASEGSRPRLPWGKQLGSLVADPRPTREILDNLCEDESLYVRKSVANHLNDISKDHPDYVLEVVNSWDQRNPHVAWITKHALRTLIKKADPATLDFMGFGHPPKLAAVTLSLHPPQVRLGDHLTLSLEILSRGSTAQSLLIDYVVHYVKASGGTSRKVFKWKEIMLGSKSSLTLKKRQLIRDFSTRKHYAGSHQVDIQIN